VSGTAAVWAQEGEEPEEETQESGPEEEPMPTPFGDVDTLDEFLAALTEAGFGPMTLQEIAVAHPWIPVPGAGMLVLDGAEAGV
jgi:hypothetical protein